MAARHCLLLNDVRNAFFLYCFARLSLILLFLLVEKVPGLWAVPGKSAGSILFQGLLGYPEELLPPFV